jgi:hypothetical protein
MTVTLAGSPQRVRPVADRIACITDFPESNVTCGSIIIGGGII